VGVLRSALAVVGVALLVAVLPATAAADSVRRTVGDYEITVGYASEPPYLEEGNALIIEVVEAATGDPVTGLEETLTVQGTVAVAQTSRSSQVPLRALPDRPGVYEGVFVPPAIGEYSFRIMGVIDGAPIDETFRSSEGGLPAVVARDAIDYTSPGSLLAIALLAAYVVGVGAILVHRRLHRPGAQVAG
jgi:hypothetical protein